MGFKKKLWSEKSPFRTWAKYLSLQLGQWRSSCQGKLLSTAAPSPGNWSATDPTTGQSRLMVGPTTGGPNYWSIQTRGMKRLT